MKMAVNNTCLYNKFGHCKYGDTCKYKHMKEVCENIDCSEDECSKRHPRTCRYFRDYRRCKFGSYCSFSHDVSIIIEKNTDNIEMKVLKEKVEKLEKIISDKDVKISSIFETIAKQNETQTKLSNALAEKSDQIANLEAKLDKPSEINVELNNRSSENILEKVMENSNHIFSEVIKEALVPIVRNQNIIEEKTNSQLENIESILYPLLSTLRNESVLKSFNCDTCSESFENQRSLNIHIRRVHNPDYT